MKVLVPWLRELVAVPNDVTTEQLADRLTEFDLKLEEILNSGVSGPLTVGRVLSVQPEEQKNGKVINWCRVDVGPEHNDPATETEPAGRGIVCGAHNFVAGDLVVVSLPGTFLPELGFEITARKTYGHVSDGMICSEAELGLGGGDHSGIIVLPADSAQPGDSGIEVLGLGDDVLDLEVNPDRAYALSMRGVARDVALAYGIEFVDPADREVPADGEAYPVRVDDPACSVFVTRVVEGFDPTRPTPAVIARRVEQAGMRSISLAVDISNYVMLELGQPNHAYDADTLNGAIGVRKAVAGEKITTLDDQERTLTPDDLLIVDDEGPIGIAGIMGGARTEISDSTTRIVIEAAHFDPPTIARGSRRHKLVSEASKRFERGVDPQLPARAAQRVAELMVELGGGTILPGLTVVGQAPAARNVTIDQDLPTRVLGIDISAETVVAALEGNGIVVDHDPASGQIVATPPSWRFDINDPYDLVEEVLRVVGYDQVPSVLPKAPGGRGLTRAQELRRRAGIAFASFGLTEVTSLPFVGESDFDKLGLDADDARRDAVVLANPLSSEQPSLTTTLLIGLLRSTALNVSRGHDDIALFEVARVFTPKHGVEAPIYGVEQRPTEAQYAALNEALPIQPHHAGWVMLGNAVKSGIGTDALAYVWSDALAVAHDLARVLNVELTVESAHYAPFHPGRCAALLLNGEIVGYAGELDPRISQAHGLPGRVMAGEINLAALIEAAPAVGEKPNFSAFPVAKEDFAFVAPSDVTAGALSDLIAGAHEFVESVRLFDIYTGDQVEAGKKSLAYKVRLRASDRTLSDADIKTAREAILAQAETLGAVLR